MIEDEKYKERNQMMIYFVLCLLDCFRAFFREFASLNISEVSMNEWKRYLDG